MRYRESIAKRASHKLRTKLYETLRHYLDGGVIDGIVDDLSYEYSRVSNITVRHYDRTVESFASAITLKQPSDEGHIIYGDAVVGQKRIIDCVKYNTLPDFDMDAVNVVLVIKSTGQSTLHVYTPRSYSDRLDDTLSDLLELKLAD